MITSGWKKFHLLFFVMKTLNFKKLSKKAKSPTRAYEYDAGFDFYATRIETFARGFIYYTGIALEIPKNYVGLMFPRSSVSSKDLILANCVGVVDSGYRGEVIFKFAASERLAALSLMKTFLEDADIPSPIEFHKQVTSLVKIIHATEIYHVGDKIGQLVILPLPLFKLNEVEELSESKRGLRGWGSSKNY